jgi:indole-3-glycerol phosphate synthase
MAEHDVDILARIIRTKEAEVARLRAERSLEELRDAAVSAGPVRGFRSALARDAEKFGQPALIAEIKKASPSKGVIRHDFDPTALSRAYERGGASCLSVLTDEQYFQGRLDYLQLAREATNLPVIRKDFIIDESQIFEARAAGADAILLIAACLEPAQLAKLDATARSVELDVLVEIHDEEDWCCVLDSGIPADLVGINNRNLKAFDVSLDVTRDLAPAVIGAGALLVSESGIFTPADVERVAQYGASALLVGESLMRQQDVCAATQALLSRKAS